MINHIAQNPLIDRIIKLIHKHIDYEATRFTIYFVLHTGQFWI